MLFPAPESGFHYLCYQGVNKKKLYISFFLKFMFGWDSGFYLYHIYGFAIRLILVNKFSFCESFCFVIKPLFPEKLNDLESQ